MTLTWKGVWYLTRSASSVSRHPVSVAFQSPLRDCSMGHNASWNKVWGPVILGSWATLGPFRQNIGQSRVSSLERDGLVSFAPLPSREWRAGDAGGRVKADACLVWAKRLMVMCTFAAVCLSLSGFQLGAPHSSYTSMGTRPSPSSRR